MDWSWRDLIARLVSVDANTRSDAAGDVGDLAPNLDIEEALVLAHLLVQLRLVEEDEWTQESQMNALAELHEYQLLPRSVVERLEKLARGPLDMAQLEHLRALGLRTPN